MIPLDFSKTYTYADYLTWAFEERVELIKGKLFNMSPAPAPRHQKELYQLGNAFAPYLKASERGCEAYPAPFDVRLPQASHTADHDISTVVQPDFCIICDLEKIDERGCLGAPDLVVEVLSPSTSKRDLNDKFDLYQEAGVQEYWLVFPGESLVRVHLLQQDGTYSAPTDYSQTDQVPVAIFNNQLHIKLAEVFV